MIMVSIIIPVYNVQKYLSQCLDSILAQTYIQWEAVLIDDGSTDESGEICDNYSNIDSRFRTVHKKNGGAASAKNCGLDCVTGDYVAFIDSDDYVESQWLEKIVSVAEREQADVVEFEFDKVYLTHSDKVNNYLDSIRIFNAEEYLAQYLSNWTSSLFCNKLFSAKLIDNIRFRKERRCIDDEFFTYKVISSANKIVRINDVLYHYRQRKSSAVSSTRNQQQIVDDALEVLIERYKWVCKKFPCLREIYLKHDVEIMFFFAGLSHTEITAKKYRNVSRYYMRQTLRYIPYGRHLLNTIRLQTISKKELLKEKMEKVEEKEIYFE